MNYRKNKFIKSAADREKIVKLTQALVRINSIHGNEREVANVLKQYLEQSGISARLVGKTPQRKSLVAHIGSGKRSIMLNGHLDTVPFGDLDSWHHHPLSGKLVKNRIYGRGSYDMKGAVAAASVSAICLAQSGHKLRGKLKLVFNYDEESGQHTGIKDILARGIRADAAICCEPSPANAVRIGAKGIYRFKLICKGTVGHTAYPQGKVNAVTKMAKLLLALERLKLSYKKHPMFSKPHITPGTVIGGGTGINIFPDQCSALVDCRLSYRQTKKQVIKEIRSCLMAQKTKDPEINYVIKEIGFVPPVLCDKNDSIVKISKECIEEHTNAKAKFDICGGVTDGNFLIKSNIPTVVLGPTGAKLHDSNEFVEIDSLVRVGELYAQIALRFLS